MKNSYKPVKIGERVKLVTRSLQSGSPVHGNVVGVYPPERKWGRDGGYYVPVIVRLDSGEQITVSDADCNRSASVS